MISIFATIRGVYVVWRRHSMLYRKYFLINSVAPVYEPLIFLMIFGTGMSQLVSEVEYHGTSVPYLQFFAPGMIAVACLSQTFYEAGFITFEALHYSKLWQARLTSSLTYDEILLGDLSWAITKGMINGFLLGIIAVLWGVITFKHLILFQPFLLLGAILMGSIGITLAGASKSHQHLQYLGHFLVSPMVFLCGAFFPRSQFPPFVETIVSALPLAPVLDLMRSYIAEASNEISILLLMILTGFALLAARYAVLLALAWKVNLRQIHKFEMKEKSQRCVRRPHFRRDGISLFCVISEVPKYRIKPNEIEIWDFLLSERDVSEVKEKFPSNYFCIEQWFSSELIEIFELKQPSSSNHDILVIEPHMDDVVLSTSGTILKSLEQHRYISSTLVRYSNFTKYIFEDNSTYLDVANVTSLRIAEHSLASRVLGITNCILDEKDAPLRWQELSGLPLKTAGDWLSESVLKDLNDYLYKSELEPQSIRFWTSLISKRLNKLKPEEVWIPLGVGGHLDHRMAREATIDALYSTGMIDKVKIYFYVEFPYVVRDSNQIGSIVDSLKLRGFELEPQYQFISDVFKDKLRLANLYSSQFDFECISGQLDYALEGFLGPNGRQTELFYKVLAVPRTVS